LTIPDARTCRIADNSAISGGHAATAFARATLRRSPGHPAAEKPEETAGSPEQIPKVRCRSRPRTGFPFGALKAAPDAASAKPCRRRGSGDVDADPGDTAALLMLRAKAAMERSRWMLRSSCSMPWSSFVRYVEAWNRRATLFYLKNTMPFAQDIREC